MKTLHFYFILIISAIYFSACTPKIEKNDLLEVKAYINDADSTVVIPSLVLAKPLRATCNDSTFKDIPLKFFDFEDTQPAHVSKWNSMQSLNSVFSVNPVYLFSNTGVDILVQISQAQNQKIENLFKDRWVQSTMIARICDITGGGEISRVKIVPKSSIGGKLTANYYFDSKHPYCISLIINKDYQVVYISESELDKLINILWGLNKKTEVKKALNEELSLTELWGIK